MSTPRDPDAVSLRDIYDLSKEIDGKLDKVNDRCTRLEGRVGTLEEESEDRKENRRTWRDYVMNAAIAAGSAIAGLLVGGAR